MREGSVQGIAGLAFAVLVATFWGGDELDISRGAETAVRARTRHEVPNQPRLNDVIGVARQNF
jgi:hypothetical protein